MTAAVPQISASFFLENFFFSGSCKIMASSSLNRLSSSSLVPSSFSVPPDFPSSFFLRWKNPRFFSGFSSACNSSNSLSYSSSSKLLSSSIYPISSSYRLISFFFFLWKNPFFSSLSFVDESKFVSSINSCPFFFRNITTSLISFIKSLEYV